MADRMRWMVLRAAVATVALIVAASACGSPTDEVATTTDWRSALLDTPRVADEELFCDTLGSPLGQTEPRTVVLLASDIDQPTIETVRATIEQRTGMTPRFLSPDDVRLELEELFASMPGLVDDAAIEATGPRFELDPVGDEDVTEIRALPGVDQVIVTPPTPTVSPQDLTVLDLLAGFWSPRVADADLILFLQPGRGDEPLSEIEAELAAQHPGAIESLTLMTQEEALTEFGELFADSPDMVTSVDPRMLPASVRILATDEDALAAIRADYEGDPRITEVIGVEPSFNALQVFRRFVADDLPGREHPALAELARTAPDELAPDIVALIEAFPDLDRLLTSALITGPGDDVAIPRSVWKETQPSIERIVGFAEATCGLTPSR